MKSTGAVKNIPPFSWSFWSKLKFFKMTFAAASSVTFAVLTVD